MAQARTGAACGGEFVRRHFAFSLARTKVTPRLVQGVNVTFLVQGDGHAAAKPDGNAGRSPSM
ncbi:Uncharacterised protein [Escherichia coli]|uniref:Uncharacterized protein n=1 Tax=Escherichia coli TaxID=562 RepID=A0A376S9V4_ECOLX|nr:Uncharacterised protein [Escherichia coli]